MRTTCNPGRLLEVEGNFVLVPSLTGRHPHVIDRESVEVSLGQLLEWFLEDPSETITGPIRIRIEAAS